MSGARVEPEDGDQQRRGGDEGEEEEFERGLGAVFAAVHGDEDGHGDERELPEAVVEHEVERDEDAEHGGLLDEEERVEDFAAGLDGVPTGDDADGREQAGEDDEPEAEAVDADVVEDGGVLDPGDVDFELKAGLAGDEVRGKMEREEEGDERGEEGDPVGELGAVGQKRNEDRAGEGNQQDEGENGLVDIVIASSSLNACITTAGEDRRLMLRGSSTNSRTAAAPSGQPRRVGAQIAGLPALENRSGKVGDAGEQPGEAAEDCGVDDPAEDVFRNGEQRLDDDGAVDFVDVVFVDEQLVAAGQRGGELRGALGLAAVELVGDEPAFKRDEDGDDAEDEFECGIAGGCRAMRAELTGARNALKCSMPIQPPQTESRARMTSGTSMDQGLSCGWASSVRGSPKKVRYQRRNM